MSSVPSVPIFLVRTDDTVPSHLRSAIEEVRSPGDDLIEVDPVALPKVVQARLRDDQSALVFMTADDPEQLGAALRAKRAGSTTPVLVVILVDAEDEALQQEATSSGLDACIPWRGAEETGETLRRTTKFALDVARL